MSKRLRGANPRLGRRILREYNPVTFTQEERVLRAFARIRGVSISAVALAALLLCAAPARSQEAPAQSTSPVPAFEITSVKRDTSEATPVRLASPDISRFTATNVSAKSLIQFAYDVRNFQLSGGPSWIDTEKFDVDGKVEDSLAQQLRALPQTEQQNQVRKMLQALLVERFKLKIRHETKDLPIFALVVAKSGPKLHEVPPPDPQTSAPVPDLPHPGAPDLPPGEVEFFIFTDGKAMFSAKAATIANLARMLAVPTGRHVDDRTALHGAYDFNLSYTMDSSLGTVYLRTPDAPPQPAGTSIFTAVQEQLGLKLESAKGPVDTIVIDDIQEPTPN